MQASSAVRTVPLAGPAVWDGRDLARGPAAWVHHLEARELDEIDAALRAVRARGLALADVHRGNFPLPTLAATLARVAGELQHGRGFAQIRGLAAASYPLADLETIFWGVAAHMGTAISQNARGDLLGHVRDEGLPADDPTVRLYQTSRRQGFHTDIGADVVGLLCVRPAKSGGQSKLASSAAIHNEILRRCPWYLGVLYDSFIYDWRGEEPPGAPPTYREPVFCWHEERFSCRYSPSLIRWAPAKSGVPLSPVQEEAMRALDEIAEEICLDIDFQPGDMQFVSNYAVLHDRTGWEDHSEPDRKRLLLRVWLTLPDGLRLPPEWGGGRARTGVTPKKPAS